MLNLGNKSQEQMDRDRKEFSDVMEQRAEENKRFEENQRRADGKTRGNGQPNTVVHRYRTPLGKFVIKLGLLMVVIGFIAYYFKFSLPSVLGIDGLDVLIYGGIICLLSVWLSQLVAFACSIWAFWIIYTAGTTAEGFSFAAIGFDTWLGAAIIVGIGALIARGLGKK